MQLILYRILTLLVLSVTAHAESQQHATAGNVVIMDGMKIAITINAVRDTGPVTRMDASGLIVKVDVFSVDRILLPERFQIVQARASSRTQSWNMDESKDISISRYFDGTGYTIIFRNGPLWSLGELLNAEFHIGLGSQILEYSAKRIEIEKN